jgi:hypothetical protein
MGGYKSYYAIQLLCNMISPVREEITNTSHKHKDKLTAHPNELATTLLKRKLSHEDWKGLSQPI